MNATLLKAIVGRAQADTTFRESLLSVEAGVLLEREFGIAIPEGMAVRFHENTKKEFHIVLPSRDLVDACGEDDGPWAKVAALTDLML